MDVLSGDGTLSWRDFYSSACAFAHKWKTLNPNSPPWTWTWLPSSTQQHPRLASHQLDGYLALENLRLPADSIAKQTHSQDDPFESRPTGKEETSFSNSEEEEPVDNATLVPQVESNNVGVALYYYDLHIVYSASYRVPVLYFRAYRTDGQTLALDEIEKGLPASSAKVLQESKWTFITQEEHPHLNRPWYKLHPCGTSEWMKLLFQSDASLAKNGAATELYLVSWLSVVGQVVGLRIPSQLLNIYDQL
ncbi:hypothetical protein UlMin_031997 [Ulmus minor]